MRPMPDGGIAWDRWKSWWKTPKWEWINRLRTFQLCNSINIYRLIYIYIYILYVFYNIYSIICCELLPYVTISGLWIQNTVNCELLAEHQKWIRLTHDWTCLVFSRFLCLKDVSRDIQAQSLECWCMAGTCCSHGTRLSTHLAPTRIFPTELLKCNQ